MPALTTYSKTLDVVDYQLITEHVHVQNIKNILGAEKFAADHQHRAWEYGLILNALRANKTQSILDVGGNGAAFAPAAAWLGMEVLQVDPNSCGQWIAEQASKIGRPLGFLQKDFFEYTSERKFNAVVSISVLEHIPEDIKFFEKLLSFVEKGGLVAITVDFHPSGELRVGGHLRTYNEAKMLQMVCLAREKGFNLFHGDCDYNYHGEDVNSYTFASLIMERL